MPKLWEYNGYKFFFFSNEGTPREPRHVHVRKGVQVAKFWLDSTVSVASSFGMSARELNMLEKLVEEKNDYFRRKWDEYFYA
ncbi:MAG: DUF4160 domain-containing protein [Fibrobacterota bacterium]